MALVLKDRVKETNSATGTSNFALTGAVAGFRSFADIGNANTTYYLAHDTTANTWEAGIGTYTASGTTLSRDTVLNNSSGGTSKISFANAPVVWCDVPASKIIHKDASGNAIDLGAATCSSITPTGLLDISASGAGQIKFPATQNASSDANTLDDYEEGTWTPGVSFGGGQVGQTYTAQLGYYIKIGRLAQYIGYCSLSNKGSSTGGAQCTGAPFSNTTASSYKYSQSGVITGSSGITSTYMQTLSTYWNGSATAFDFGEVNAGAYTQLTNSAFATSSLFYFSINVILA